MRMSRPVVAAALSVTMLALSVGVAYAATSTTIGELIANPAAFIGKLVSFSGKVTAVDGNEFTVTDGSSSMKVEAGPKWFKKVDVKAGDELNVTGEVDEEGRPGAKTGKYAVDASTLAGPRGTIEVRKAEGPPPWAGGPKRVGKSHPGYGKADGADDDGPEAPDADDDSGDSGGGRPPWAGGKGKP